MERKKRSQLVVSILLEEFLLTKIEAYRRACMRRSGHMSRSAAVRHLVDLGLEAVAADGVGGGK